MKTALKIRLFRKEMKKRFPQVEARLPDEEVLAYIDTANKAFRNFSEEKQIKMAAALAADHYISVKRLQNLNP